MVNKKTIIASLALIALAFLLFGCTQSQTPTGNALGITAQGQSDAITIPLQDITEQAHFYEYNSNGATIRYFAVKASDGSIKTAFDACDVCYNKKKGYRQEGDKMICNNCGNVYEIDKLGTENKKGGGCWPGYLPNKVSDDSLVINKADLEKGRYRFA